MNIVVPITYKIGVSQTPFQNIIFNAVKKFFFYKIHNWISEVLINLSKLKYLIFVFYKIGPKNYIYISRNLKKKLGGYLFTNFFIAD